MNEGFLSAHTYSDAILGAQYLVRCARRRHFQHGRNARVLVAYPALGWSISNRLNLYRSDLLADRRP